MKQLILTTLITAITAVTTPVFAQFKDCEKTRLGCLDKIGPGVPIDQPVLIQIGLQVNIKCEALAEDGKSYLVDLHLVKKVQASEYDDLNYYLVPGKQGTLNFQIHDDVAPEVQQYIMGDYVFDSEIEASTNSLMIKAHHHRSTRVGSLETSTELEFSSSVQGQPLKILSALQIESQNSFFNKDAKPSTTQLKFTESNCVYY